MGYNITLTSSMRSNLLSLKNIATQMSKTQNILSTGKKVNSAIDNAGAYYQARSLTNRASDLNSLLDSMSQGIQTIQTATEGLSLATNLIDQASVIATQAYETAEIPTKDWFVDQVGENGAVVSTAQELKEAISANKETICVYGKIDYFENEAITLKDKQKLVGISYFGNFDRKFSTLTIDETSINLVDNNTLSDLTINFNSTTHKLYCIFVRGNAIIANCELNKQNVGTDWNYVIGNLSSGDLTLQGNIIINNKLNSKDRGIVNYGNLIITHGATIKINTNNHGYTNYPKASSKTDIYGKLLLNGAFSNEGGVTTFHNGSYLRTRYLDNIYPDSVNTTCIFEKGAILNFNTRTDYKINNDKTLINTNLYKTDIKTHFDITEKEAWQEERNKQNEDKFLENQMMLGKYIDQYSDIMHQFDNMIIDSSYQGTNLLTGGVLELTFNENHTHKLLITGNDMRSEELGIKTEKWTTKDDIKNTIEELLKATKTMREYQSELGTHYQVIQTQQNFTEALAEVLEEGADDLVLADMNEASAEYLMLQTRQQLAVNSLSLASQSASSILRLF